VQGEAAHKERLLYPQEIEKGFAAPTGRQGLIIAGRSSRPCGWRVIVSLLLKPHAVFFIFSTSSWLSRPGAAAALHLEEVGFSPGRFAAQEHDDLFVLAGE
jgi:hypothetical protein